MSADPCRYCARVSVCPICGKGIDLYAEAELAKDRLRDAAPLLLAALEAIVSDGMHCDVVPHLHRKALEAIAAARVQA